MLVSIGLTLVLALLTFNRWKRPILSTMLSNIVGTPYQYCYVSTLYRYICIGTLYCFVFTVLIWGSGFLLSNILWRYIDQIGVKREAWLAISVPTLILMIYGVCWLPGLRVITLGLHRSIMRHLYFPVIPSTKEEYAINQLLQATEENRDFSASEPALSIAKDKNQLDVQRQIHSMSIVYDKLALLFEGRSNQVKMLMYGDEWLLIHNLYKAIVLQLRNNSRELNPDLVNTIQFCQYYCCHLLVRYWFNTTFTEEQRQVRLKDVAA